MHGVRAIHHAHAQ